VCVDLSIAEDIIATKYPSVTSCPPYHLTIIRTGKEYPVHSFPENE
jgi:hypothetical protein